jgi:hypothetical protein
MVYRWVPARTDFVGNNAIQLPVIHLFRSASFLNGGENDRTRARSGRSPVNLAVIVYGFRRVEHFQRRTNVRQAH